MGKIDWSRVKAVVFDFDGTLYNKSYFPLWLLLRNPLQVPSMKAERKTRKEMKNMDLGSGEAFNSYFYESMGKKQGRSAAEAKVWFNDFYLAEFLRILKKHYQPYPNIPKVLEKLGDLELKTAVFSDYSRTDERLEALGLSVSDFGYCYSAPDMGGLKPTPRLIREIVDEMQIDGSEVLVVGDRVDTDGESAFAVNGQFIQIVKKPAAQETEYPQMLWNDFVEEVLNVPVG
ncbi:MAG: HAD family hydrolase [Paludibacteraceae bacterium]|nr:HAD family hydrolase [Paludibacteraceae bacterium]